MKTNRCLKCKKKFPQSYSSQKFCSLKCANRYNLNGLNKVSLPRKNKELAEFVGIILGDGNVNKYFTTITLNSIADMDYIGFVYSLSKNLFPGASVTILPKKKGNATTIQISSRIVSDFLYGMHLIPHKKLVPNWILKNHQYKIFCLRGLIDTEGSISFKKHCGRKRVSIYKQLNFRNADQKLMRFVRDILCNMGLKPTMTLKRSLYLSNHSAINSYQNRVGFSNNKLLCRSGVIDWPSYEKWRGTEVAITGRS